MLTLGGCKILYGIKMLYEVQLKFLLLFQPVYFCVGFFRDTKGQGSQFIKFSLCVLGGLQSSYHKM